jgi:hypothetical protein
LYVKVDTQQTSSNPMFGWDINIYGQDKLSFYS